MSNDGHALDVFVNGFVAGVLLGVWVSRLLRVKWLRGLLFSWAVNVVVAVWLVTTVLSPDRVWFGPRPDDAQIMLKAAATFVVANLGIALLIKIYRAAVLGYATVEEKSAGLAGVRAWLSPTNVITAVALWISACLGFDANIFGVFVAVAGLLLAYPMMNTLMQSKVISAPAPAPPQAPAEERQRVLALVEAGKITAEEAAELLSALAQSQTAQTEASAVTSGPRRMILAGAGAVLVAFFMPWFTFNISNAMNDAMANMRQSLPQFSGVSSNSFGQSPEMSGGHVPFQTQAALMTVTLRGGDVRNGLGWITLAAGLGVAGLPFFWTPRSGQTLQNRNIILATLAVGTVAMLYLLSNSFNSVTSIEPGFFLAMAGYALLWFGVIREYVSRTLIHQPRLASV